MQLILPYGSESGILQGTFIEVVRRSFPSTLGLVQVVEVEANTSFAEPFHRAVPEFWEELEDRMKRDYRTPDDVVARVLMVNPLVLAELEALLRRG